MSFRRTAIALSVAAFPVVACADVVEPVAGILLVAEENNPRPPVPPQAGPGEGKAADTKPDEAKPPAAPAVRPPAAPNIPVIRQAAAAEEAAPKPENANRPDENFLKSQRRQRDSIRNSYVGTPDGGEANLEDLVQIVNDGPMLKLEALGPVAAQRSQRFKLKDSDATLILNRTVNGPIGVGNGQVRPASTSVSLTRIDHNVSEDETIYSTSASQTNNFLSISGQSVLGRVTFSQNNNVRPGVARGQAVRFTVYEWQAGPRQRSVFSATADSIDRLRAEHPTEFRKYLMPIFRKLSDMSWMIPGASDVYGVFSELSPDPQMTARVQALLPDLDSDAYAVREAAGRQLIELGADGVLATLRLDPESLSDEQKGQLGRLIAAHRRREIENPEEARKNVAFLSDCLEHPDGMVREAAKGSLEKVLGRSLDFDTKLTGDALIAAADNVRRLVQEATPSATQPAGELPQPAPDVQVRPMPAVIEPQILIR